MSRWHTDAFHPDLRVAARLLPRTTVNRHTVGPTRRLSGLGARRRVTDVTVESVSRHATVRVHRNGPKPETGAAVLWLHGGGLVIGSPRQDDRWCRRIAGELDVTVAATSYRLAPQHPYPAALDDCLAAYLWLTRQPTVDPNRVAIGGASAGGGLAAALALRIRDEGHVAPAFQLLVYPMLDDRTAAQADSAAEYRRLWNNKSNAFGWASYLGAPPGSSGVSAHAAPARCTDLSGLPPAWVGVGSLDLFYDEDVTYAQRLQAAGVRCELVTIPGAFHGFDAVPGKSAVTRDFRNAQIAALAEALSLEAH
jgi:acetyl esterase/lipase